MNKTIIPYFEKIGLSPTAVDDIITSTPEVAYMSNEELISKIDLVVAYGYPVFDVATLVQVNPSFLLRPIKDLEKVLASLGVDVEEKLKQDPFLI